MTNCPNNILKARIKSGMSQKEVAISLHVSAPTVSDWERQKKYPTIENLKALSALFNVSIDYLLGQTDEILMPKTHKLNDEDFSDFSIFIQKLGFSARFGDANASTLLIRKDGTNIWIPLSEGRARELINASRELMQIMAGNAAKRLTLQIEQAKQYLFSLPDENGMLPQDDPEIKELMDEFGRQLLLEKNQEVGSSPSHTAGTA